MDKKTPIKSIVTLTLLVLLVLIAGFALLQMAEPHSSIVIVKNYYACTNNGVVDMSISEWERIALSQ